MGETAIIKERLLTPVSRYASGPVPTFEVVVGEYVISSSGDRVFAEKTAEKFNKLDDKRKRVILIQLDRAKDRPSWIQSNAYEIHDIRKEVGLTEAEMTWAERLMPEEARALMVLDDFWARHEDGFDYGMPERLLQWGLVAHGRYSRGGLVYYGWHRTEDGEIVRAQLNDS